MKTIYLVRHGEKVLTIGDPPLSEVGIRQAERTGIYLQKFPIDAIYASPLLRTQQTAQQISTHTHAPVFVDKRLRERMNWGDVPNQPLREFLAEWENTSKDRTFKPLCGDSSIEAGQRLKSVIDYSIKSNHSNIILVTHGGIIVDFLRNVFSKGELDSAYKMFSSMKEEAIKECSITTLRIDDDKYIIKKIGDIEHLYS